MFAKKHFIEKLTLICILAVISVPCAHLASIVSMWGPDQSVAYAQGCHALNSRAYPLWGLINSLSFRNTNALVLLIIPLLSVTKHPFAISFVLSLIQIAVVTYAYFRLCSIMRFKPQALITIPILTLFVMTPNYVMTSTEVYAQFFCRTLSLALVVNLFWIFNQKQLEHRQAILPSFLAGVWITLLPAIHFATFSYYPFLIPLFFLAYRRKKLNFSSFGIGVLIVTFAVWVPWSYFCMGDALSVVATNATKPFNSLMGVIGMCLSFFSTLGESAILQGCPDSNMPSFRIYNILKVIFIASTIALVVFNLKRKRSKQLLMGIFIVLAILFLNVLYAKARNDYLINFSTSFFLLAALLTSKYGTVFSRWLSMRRFLSMKIINAILFLFTIATILLWGRVFMLKYERQLHYRKFEVSDVPLYDKIDILNKMIQTTTDRDAKNSTFAILNRDYPKIFGFILYFKALDIDGLYGEDTFYTTYLNNIQRRTVFKCVHWSAKPEFLIKYTSKNPKKFFFKDKSGNRISYSLLTSGIFLKLYSRN